MCHYNISVWYLSFFFRSLSSFFYDFSNGDKDVPFRCFIRLKHDFLYDKIYRLNINKKIPGT